MAFIFCHTNKVVPRRNSPLKAIAFRGHFYLTGNCFAITYKIKALREEPRCGKRELCRKMLRRIRKKLPRQIQQVTGAILEKGENI